MARRKTKRTYAKVKAEDYIFERKIKFFLSRIYRISQILFSILLVCLLAWIIFFSGYQKLSDFVHDKSTSMFISLGLKINSLEIEGNKIVPTEIILEKIFSTIGNVRNKSIILLSSSNLVDNLSSIGWIESVSVRKKLPDTMIIKITERSPKVIWQNEGKIWLGDNEGNLLTDDIEKKYIYLPLIIGENPVNDIPELFAILKQAEGLYTYVKAASKVGNRRWDVLLSNNIKIMLPENDAKKAWAKLAEIEKETNILNKKISYIDMRIEGQLTTGLDNSENAEIIEKQKELQKKYGG